MVLALQSSGERKDESQSTTNDDRDDRPAGTRLDVRGSSFERKIMLVTFDFDCLLGWDGIES